MLTPHRDAARGFMALAALLFVANTLSFIDRQVLTLLVRPVRADLRISDTSISLLQGLAFASLYAVLGLPLGHLADRVNRPRLIGIGMLLWSAMTVASGLSHTFGQLFVSRMGVAVGEAALAPAAVSLLAERASAGRVGLALAVFQSGIFVGSALALLAGGWLLGAVGDHLTLPGLGRVAGWRIVFLSVATPGVVLGAAMLFLPDPRARSAPDDGPTVAEAGRWIAQRAGLYGNHLAAFTAVTVLVYGTLAWAPSVLVRVHAMSSAGAGVALGAVMLIAGPLGVLVSGQVTDRLLRSGRVDGPVISALVGVLLLAIAAPAFALAPTLPIALAMSPALAFAQGYPYGIASAALALVTPPRMRGQVTALYLLVSNLLGLSLGPLLVASLTDRVFRDDHAVGWSLAVLPLVTLPVAAAALVRLRAPFGKAWREAVA